MIVARWLFVLVAVMAWVVVVPVLNVLTIGGPRRFEDERDDVVTDDFVRRPGTLARPIPTPR